MVNVTPGISTSSRKEGDQNTESQKMSILIL